MATRAEIRAQRRAERRAQRSQERQSKRRAARQAKAGSGLFTGIGARMQQRQTARQQRKSDRISARTSRIQSRSEGGFYDPESVAARYGAVSSIADTIGAAAGGGWSEIADSALGAITDNGIDDQGGELVEGPWVADEGPGLMIPLIIGGTVLGAFLLFRKPKGKKK